MQECGRSFGAPQVMEVSGTAWSSDPFRLPEDTWQALETDGPTELLKVLDQDDQPPRDPMPLCRLLVPLCEEVSNRRSERERVRLDAESEEGDLECAVEKV
jgi:hypothetical protein